MLTTTKKRASGLSAPAKTRVAISAKTARKGIILPLPKPIIKLNQNAVLVHPTNEKMFEELSKQGFKRRSDVPKMIHGQPYYKYSKGN